MPMSFERLKNLFLKHSLEMNFVESIFFLFQFLKPFVVVKIM